MGPERIHPRAVCCASGVPTGPRLIPSCRILAKISAPRSNSMGVWNALYESAICTPKRWVQFALTVWTDGWYDVTAGSMSVSTVLLNIGSTRDKSLIVVRRVAKDACTPPTPCIVISVEDVGSLSLLTKDCEIKELLDHWSISALTSWHLPWWSWTWKSYVARSTVVDKTDTRCDTKARSNVRGTKVSSIIVAVLEFNAPEGDVDMCKSV